MLEAVSVPERARRVLELLKKEMELVKIQADIREQARGAGLVSLFFEAVLVCRNCNRFDYGSMPLACTSRYTVKFSLCLPCFQPISLTGQGALVFHVCDACPPC